MMDDDDDDVGLRAVLAMITLVTSTMITEATNNVYVMVSSANDSNDAII